MRYLLLFSLLLSTSCARYHFGVSLPSEQRAIEVSSVENLTSESRLEALLRNSLSESIMNTPGIHLSKPGSGSVALSARIVELEQQRGARTRLRDHHDADDSGATYQTVVFRMSVKVEYRLLDAAGAELRSGVTSVSADYPVLSDQESARVAALREAMRTAAQKIVAEVTEG